MDLFNLPFFRSYEVDLGWIIRTVKIYTKKVDDLYNFGLYDYVEKVLAAHPEWTTTVMDGAVTIPKLAADVKAELAEEYFPVQYGEYKFTSTEGNNTFFKYAIIDKDYKPDLVMANDTDIFERKDMCDFATENKATIAINAGTLHNGYTTSGTVIVNGAVKHINTLDSNEWGPYDLQNLYMTADGALHVQDAFDSVADMMDNEPVWSVCGWNAIYMNGSLIPSLYDQVYTPKTIIGQDYDGNYIVAVSGGRRPDDYGVKYSEVVNAIITGIGFNAKILYNMDGGGSSALLYDEARVNRLIENEPRPVSTAIVFKLGESVNTSMYEGNKAGYHADVTAMTSHDYSFSNIFKLISNVNEPQFLIQDVADNGYDKMTYNNLLRVMYNKTNHYATVEALKGDGTIGSCMAAEFDRNSATMLGKEVLRGLHIKEIVEEHTTNGSGAIDSNSFNDGALDPRGWYVLAAHTETNSAAVRVSIYNNRFIFTVINNSTGATSPNTPVKLHVLAIEGPDTPTA